DRVGRDVVQGSDLVVRSPLTPVAHLRDELPKDLFAHGPPSYGTLAGRERPDVARRCGEGDGSFPSCARGMEDAMTIPWRRQAILTATVLLLLGAGPTVDAWADGGGGGSDARENLSRGTPEDPEYTAAVRAIKADKYAQA